MDKFYRVKKDTFLWEEGAIIKLESYGYYPISDIWDATPVNGREYISKGIIEHPNNADCFERVYTDDIKGKIFKTAEQLKKSYNDAFKS